MRFDQLCMTQTLKHFSPYVSQDAWTLGYSECTEPDGVHVGLGRSGLPRAFGKNRRDK